MSRFLLDILKAMPKGVAFFVFGPAELEWCLAEGRK